MRHEHRDGLPEPFLANAFVLQRNTNRFHKGSHGDWGVGVT
jgi:hypothetical protein